MDSMQRITQTINLRKNNNSALDNNLAKLYEFFKREKTTFSNQERGTIKISYDYVISSKLSRKRDKRGE